MEVPDLVSCIACERAMKMSYVDMKNAYPVRFIGNVITQNGFKPSTISAYLCEAHFKEYYPKLIDEDNQYEKNL